MSKVMIRYEKLEEKEKIVRALSKEFKIKKISEPYGAGKFNRIYISLE